MLSAYPALFIKETTGYSVLFPDLDYLATTGNSLDDALVMAVDCLAGFLYLLKKDKEEPPVASAVNDIDPSSIASDLGIELEEYFVNLVTVDVEEYAKKHFEKSVKKTLTIPAWLNDVAMEQNINFSQVLQEALKEKLNLV